MTPTHPPSADSAAAVECCDVLGCGAICATIGELQAARGQPHPLTGKPFPPGTFKHTDEQTVAALLAVWQAMKTMGPDAGPFTDWGVLAAPRFIGRTAMAQTLERFATEGAWGISPHLIPHRSLHTISGTISQVLGIHGPNFGIGGGPGSASEALLAVPPLLAFERLPGLWLVLTCWSKEPIPQRGQAPIYPGPCVAVALALAPASSNAGRFTLRISPHTTASLPDGATFGAEPLHDSISAGGPAIAAAWQLAGGGEVVLERRQSGEKSWAA